MADDRNVRGAVDGTRINMHEDYAVRYWTKKWNVTPDQLAAAVRQVGGMVADVAKKLGKVSGRRSDGGWAGPLSLLDEGQIILRLQRKAPQPCLDQEPLVPVYRPDDTILGYAIGERHEAANAIRAGRNERRFESSAIRSFRSMISMFTGFQSVTSSLAVTEHSDERCVTSSGTIRGRRRCC